MKYIKIRAKTYNETMMKLKMEYGDDAIPVSHKYVKEGGLFKTKIFAKDVVELTAAIPERKSMTRNKQVKKNKIDFTVGDSDIKRSLIDSKNHSSVSGGGKSDDIKKTIDAANRISDIMKNGGNAGKKDHLQMALSNPEDDEGTAQVSKEEFSIKKGYENEFQKINHSLNTLIKNQNNGFKGVSQGILVEDELMEPYLAILRKNEFDQKDCNSILEGVKNSISKDDLKDRFKIEKTLKDLLKCRIVTNGPFKKGVKKKIVMFIGPTGVGKTTTIAKLGAIYALRESYNVAFVTIDTYRIAATEQLKKYAGIMKVPIHVVSDQNYFKEVIEKEKSELIMVDTSGRSHKNELKISEIKSYADMVECDFEKILCVSANTKRSDLDDVFYAFNKISFNSIIITKVDETSSIGSIIHIADKYNKPISYFTNGQEVPNDIVVADPDRIADIIIKGADENYSGG